MSVHGCHQAGLVAARGLKLGNVESIDAEYVSMSAERWTRGHISGLAGNIESRNNISFDQRRIGRTLRDLVRTSRDVVENPVHNRKQSETW